MKFRSRQLLVLLTTTLVTACGGGGGGSDGGGNGQNPAPPGPTTSGLVPAAPTLGATLQVDARVLRPLREGAVWTYRGSFTASSGATPVVYTNRSVQSAVSTAGATETQDNSGNAGRTTSTFDVAGGTIGEQVTFNFSGKQVEALQLVELRSPVRQGDQVVMLDRRYTDTTIDADRDGRTDVLDVAIYALVVGTETLRLPNLPALNTVRVDATIASRVIFSSTGQLSAVTQSTVQTWYAPGIGIVRQASATPTSSGVDVERTDEQIVSWDGGSTGLGAMSTITAVLPDNSPLFPGVALPAPAQGVRAFAFPNHVLVLTPPPGAGAFGLLATRLDLLGKPISAVLLNTLLPRSDATFVGHDSGVLLIEPIDVATAQARAMLTRLDPAGALEGSIRGAAAALDGGRLLPVVGNVVAAAEGSTLWLMWARSYRGPTSPLQEIVARAFSFAGTPLTDEVVLDSSGGSPQSLACSAGSCVASWISFDRNDVMYTPLQRTAAAVSAAPRRLTAGLPNSNSFITALRLGAGNALVWPALLGSGTTVGSSGGVTLDANFGAVRSAGSLDGELLAGTPNFDSTMPGAAARESRLVITGSRRALLYAQDTIEQPVNVVSWIDTDGTALAARPVHSVRYATPSASKHLVLADRVLVFAQSLGSNGFVVTTTVVWLNRGS